MRITEITMMTFELLPSLFPPKTNYDDDSNQIPLPSALLKRTCQHRGGVCELQSSGGLSHLLSSQVETPTAPLFELKGGLRLRLRHSLS